LIALMDGKQPGTNAPGSIEFGIVLYWLDTDHPELAKLLELPPTAITSAMLSDWLTILMNQDRRGPRSASPEGPGRPDRRGPYGRVGHALESVPIGRRNTHA